MGCAERVGGWWSIYGGGMLKGARSGGLKMGANSRVLGAESWNKNWRKFTRRGIRNRG